jgi:hypothetical protein
LHVCVISLNHLAKVIDEKLIGLVPEFSLVPHIYRFFLCISLLSSLCVLFELLGSDLRVEGGFLGICNELLNLLDLDFSDLFCRGNFDLFFHYNNN